MTAFRPILHPMRFRCPCGTVYHRTEERLASPGHGRHACVICDRLLEEWDGHVVPSFRLVKLPDVPNDDELS